MRRRLDRLYNVVETTDLDMSDVTPRIRDHRERQERLEASATEARAILSQRRGGTGRCEHHRGLRPGHERVPERERVDRAQGLHQTFVKEIVVTPGNALMRYTVPMPDDSLIPGRVAEKVALNGSVLSTVQNGGPKGLYRVPGLSWW